MSDNGRAVGLLIGVVIAVVVLGGLTAGVVIYQGFVLSALWYWFVVPFGVPELNLAWACGLMTVVHMVTSSSADSPYSAIQLIDPYRIILNIGEGKLPAHSVIRLKAQSRQLAEAVVKKHTEHLIWGLAKPMVALIIGWAVHLFM